MNNVRVFVVDDDPYYLNLFEQYLFNEGIDDIFSFLSGVECLSAIHLEPDIIFLDYNMEFMNGEELMKKILRINPNIFIVMISSQQQIHTAVNALKKGAFDYLEKSNDEQNQIKNILHRMNEVKDILAREREGTLKKIMKYF